MPPRIDAFLQLGREQGCSDIHFTVGLPPLARQDGDLMPMKYRELTDDETSGLIREILNEDQNAEFDRRGSVDLAYESEDAGRFRINVCRHVHGTAAICRVIPGSPPRLADLGLPKILKRFTRLNSGLVLVTGASGTGKSTTLAAMIDEINRERSLNILTLEDPIEFLHPTKQSLVVQREVGVHVSGFRDGLRSALRQDPDVILLGEMRDLETVQLAIEASETGHLVLATLHTRGAAESIDRIVDTFPTEGQAQVRTTLADNLKAVVSQELVRAADGRGRRAVVEILVVTAAVSQLIRDAKTFQIPSAIATGRRQGMQLLDQALHDLVRIGEIDPDEAFLKAEDKREFIPHVTKLELLDLVGPPAREDS
ncbi:PilT/PilU family type 4a pilus ATPase [bacterium]|nr:PilT/PilU family type 4a pilus ATPase [bacterium]